MNLLGTVLGFIATLLNKWLATKRAEQALRDMGALVQANDSRVVAEKQEAQAHAAADKAEASFDPNKIDESDPFLRKD